MGLGRIELIKETLRHRCAHNALNIYFIKRWLYTLKAIICIMFGLHHEFGVHDDRNNNKKVVRGVARFNRQRINWHPDTSVSSWTEIAVGRGIFRRWFYEIFTNYSEEGEMSESDQSKGHHGVQKINMSCLWHYGGLSSRSGGDNLPPT